MNDLINNFITTFKREAILGYELIEDSDDAISSILRSSKLNKDFTALLSDGVDSIIAIWNISNENQPIVYFNSEASPFAVVALNLEEFFSSLYYGEYGVFDISNHVNYIEMKSLYEKMGLEYDGIKPKALSADELLEIEFKLREEYSNYDQIIGWFKENNIQRNPSPYTSCVHAYTISPNVKEYIDNQLGALPVEEFAPLTRLKNLINKSLPLLNQVKSFDEFHQFCVDFYAESGIERPINLSLGTKNSAAITTLKKYPYPADFIEWHEKFGNTNLFLNAIEINPTISISNNLEGYAKVLTANNYLLMTIDTSGYLYVYNVNIPEHPQLMVLRQSSYYPADKLGEFYSELLNFKYDESTQEINNPNGLDEADVIDENKKFNLTASYIKDYLDIELEYVLDGDTFLQFLIARTKEGFEEMNSRYLYLNDFLKNELNPDWQTCYNKGLKYAKEGKIDLALKEFQKAILIRPNEESYASLGQMYRKLGDNENAILSYKKSLELNPNHTRTYNNLAFLYYQLNRFQEASETIDQATLLEPETGLYHLTKAEITFALKDLEACYTALEKAALVKSDPKGAEAIIEKTLGKEQRYKDIIKLYKDTLKAAEKSKQDFLKKLKPSSKKTKELILALQEDDKQSKVWKDLGLELIELKDYKNAVLAFSAGEEISPTDFYILINKGTAYDLKGDLELAKKSYLRGILFHPNKSRLWYKIATIYFKEKEAQKGFDAMQKAIELTPKESYYYPMIAYNAVLYGNLPLCLQYSKAGTRRGNASNSYLNLGHIHLIQQEPEQAVLCYARSYFGFKKPSSFWGDYKSDFEVMPQYNISRATYDALIPLIEKRIENGLRTIEDFSAFWSRGINTSTDLFDAAKRAKFEQWGYPKVFLDWLELGNHSYSSEVISGEIDGFMFDIFHSEEIEEAYDVVENNILLENDYLIFGTYCGAEYYVFDKQNNNQVFFIELGGILPKFLGAETLDFLPKLLNIETVYKLLSFTPAQAEFDKDPSLKYEDKAQTILRVKSPYIRAYIQKYLFLEKGKRYENFLDFIEDKSEIVINYLAKEHPELRIAVNAVVEEKEETRKEVVDKQYVVDITPVQFPLETICTFLESDDLQQVSTGIEKLKENPNDQAEVEKRYLHFIQARLGRTDVGLEQFAEARLNTEEKKLLTGRDIKDTYISLARFDDSECKLVVDFIGSMVKNHLRIDDYIKEVKACKNESELEVIYNSYCTSCYNGIAREIALYPNCPYSKIAHHILELDLRKVMFEKTKFVKTNRSIVLREFMFFLNLRNNGSVYLDIYQSDVPDLTEMFWLLPSIPKTNWGETDVTFPKSPLSFKRKGLYKTDDFGAWNEIEG